LKLQAQGWCPQGCFPGMPKEAERVLPHGMVSGYTRSCRSGRETGCVAVRPSFGRGNAPGRMNPKRARDAARGEIRRRCAPTDGGLKPLKRGHRGGYAYSAEKRTEHRDPRGTSQRFRPTSWSDDGQSRRGAT
jgi:hypothetical protein